MDENAIVENNTGLVYAQLHRFKLAYDPDAISYGFEGLLKAIRTYDEDKHIQFSTYATVCIYNAIGTYARTLSKKRVVDTISYDEELTDDGFTLLDTLCCSTSPEEEYMASTHLQHILEVVNSVYNSMADNASKRVIRAWIDSGFTSRQQPLADAAKVSQVTVSRAIAAFRHKLKMELEGYYE